MASGTTNSQYFLNNYFMYATSAAGVYTIGSTGGHGITVTDTPDNASDNTTVLGDIQNDVFTTVKGTSAAGTRTYFGEIANAGGVVTTFKGKKGLVYALYTNNTYATGDSVTVDQGSFALMCFASGTAIRTVRGDVPVEALSIDDRVVTGSGATRPVKWIGCRHVGGDGRRLPAELRPVRILAEAFGPGVPCRDLMLSPGHPVLVGADEDGRGGHLVPVMCLINGTTVDRVDIDDLTYWHVELDEHDILLAEGLRAESYLDLGSRAFFEGSDDLLHNPDGLVTSYGRCRPVATSGAAVDMARAELDRVFASSLSGQCMWSDGLDAMGLEMRASA